MRLALLLLALGAAGCVARADDWGATARCYDACERIFDAEWAECEKRPSSIRGECRSRAGAHEDACDERCKPPSLCRQPPPTREARRALVEAEHEACVARCHLGDPRDGYCPAQCAVRRADALVELAREAAGIPDGGR